MSDSQPSTLNPPRNPPFGVLNIHKPPAMTSRAVVDRVVRFVKPAKAGHAGTLDPLATGVLVVCVGSATRLISYVQQQPKRYTATFLLGRRSNTDDVEGEITKVDASVIEQTQIEAALPQFLGSIQQVPPKFSAVHVGGQRAYKLARRGAEVELQPRTVEVSEIRLVDYEYPRLRLEIECGSGTYIRSIGRDLGERLGCGAVMSELVRTQIGPFRLEDAHSPQSLTRDTIRDAILPARTAVPDLPYYIADEAALDAYRYGRPMPVTAEWRASSAGSEVAVLDEAGRLAAIAEYDGAARLHPRHVFLSAR